MQALEKNDDLMCQTIICKKTNRTIQVKKNTNFGKLSRALFIRSRKSCLRYNNFLLILKQQF